MKKLSLTFVSTRPAPPSSSQVAMRAAVSPTAGIPIHIEYCEK